jgi:hypothetical protein
MLDFRTVENEMRNGPIHEELMRGRRLEVMLRETKNFFKNSTVVVLVTSQSLGYGNALTDWQLP